jgi:glutathione S-transferase
VKYADVEVARTAPGVRLVLTQGFPGPWGQALKKLLLYKGIDYVPVAQYAGEDNAALKAWVGVRNAPVIVSDNERPLTTWFEAILFAERRKPSPALLPRDSESRALVFGLIHELAGENGLGWCMRLMMFRDTLAANPAARTQSTMAEMMTDYGVTESTMESAPERVIDILEMLTRRLMAQRALGSDYLVGTRVTAADIYWACFSIMVQPLPDALCPMTPELRRSRTPVHAGIIAAARAPVLIEHRDRMFERFLGPLEF